jgi:hypothetical protein
MNCLELVWGINKLPADVICKLGNGNDVVYARANAHLDLNHSTEFVT